VTCDWDEGPPPWAVMTPSRRAHVTRVVALLDQWADAQGVSSHERARWRRAGWLHDALKDAPLESLRGVQDAEFRDASPKLWHGPAAAARATREGEQDAGVLAAVRYHTVGSATWDRVGHMLYLADHLEPGRPHDPRERASLVERVAAGGDEVEAVVTLVLTRRSVHTSADRMHPQTVAWLRTLGR